MTAIRVAITQTTWTGDKESMLGNTSSSPAKPRLMEHR